MSTWQERYSEKQTTAQGAVKLIPKGKHVFISSGASEPVNLVHQLVEQADHFADNTIVHLLTLGPAPYVDKKYQHNFRHNAFFIGPNVREAVHQGRADYTPVFLSQIPSLIRSRRMPVDVALIQVSPPDPFGFVNLGISVDIVLSAIEAAKLVIAEINPNMPVVLGSGFIPMNCIDAWIEVDNPIVELPPEPLDEVALEIGRNVASLVEDRATIQIGIGQIPDAVLEALTDKKDLGVWTEMFSDGVISLIENGNISGRYKTIHPNKVSSSFCFGSRRLYDYIDRNPTFTFHPSDYMNNPINIAQQHRMVAINSALQIDLTGQVCADSIGNRFYSGIGGQVDFIRGSSMCPDGKPIIAIRSTAKQGQLSRLVANLDSGAGVVTSRGDVRYVVTEYGIADLQGRSVRERALSLISIAHPDYRSELLMAAKQRHYIVSGQASPQVTYLEQYERPIPGAEGMKLSVRPSRLTDEPKLTDFFYSLSEDTIYKRWMGMLERLPRKELINLLDVDYKRNMTVVVEHEVDGKEPELVGLGRYETDMATYEAEVAFVVRDDWQGQGLGNELLASLIQIARDHSIQALTAKVLADNEAMMSVFYRSGLRVKSNLRGRIYEVVMPLHERRPKRATVVPI